MIYPDFKELLDLQHQARKLRNAKDKSSSEFSGEHKSHLYGSGLEFEEVREYVFGDDIRDIDWRVTARTGKVHSKLFKIDSEQTINIAVDVNPNMHFGTKSTFKSIQAARIASLIAWNANQNHNKVGGMIYGGKRNEIQLFQPTRNKQSLLRLLKSLCEKEIGQNYISLHQNLTVFSNIIPNSSKVYIISDFSNLNFDLTLKKLKRLREKNCKIFLIQVIDERDYDIPNIGLISFQDSLGKEFLINTANKSGKESFFKLWRINQDSLQILAKKTQAKLMIFKTNDDVYLKFKNGI